MEIGEHNVSKCNTHFPHHPNQCTLQLARKTAHTQIIKQHNDNKKEIYLKLRRYSLCSYIQDV